MKKRNYYQWMQYWTMLYFVSMFLIFPIIFRNNYIDILETKTIFYKSVTAIYLITGIIIIWLTSIFEAEDKRKNKYKVKADKGLRITKQDKWMLAFTGSIVLSTVLSGDVMNAWYSPNGKLFGTVVILLSCGTYFLIAKDGVYINSFLKISLITGFMVVSVLAIMNRYQLDPLQMYSNLVPKQKPVYISTMGNVNIVSGYLCIFVPLFAGAFLYTKEPVFKLMYGLAFCVGVMAGICTNSDSFFIGIGSALLFLLWVSMEQKNRLLNFTGLCILGTISFLWLGMLEALFPKCAVWESLQKSLINNTLWGVVLFSLILLGGIIKRCESESFFPEFRKVLFAFIGIGFLCLLFYIVILNIRGDVSEDSILLFDDSWGTNRGFVWKRTWILFEELPFYRKIIGIGPGAFKDYFTIYNEERINNSLMPFVDPHSEYLYYLVSMGLLGAAAYFGTIITAIRNCIKKKSDICFVLLAVFASWLVQGIVNNPIIFTTPYLFLFLGIISSENKKCE